MNESLHPEVAILNAALELPRAERAAYLDRVCADEPSLRQQVEALLCAHDQAADFLETLPTGPSALRAHLEGYGLSEKPGERIGHYKLLAQIGEGGCGAVYLAEQEEPVRRQVALKVIKVGMDTRSVIGRFEAERQALAIMDHPNIAKVFDAGATANGRPYFVMELVTGVRITDYCEVHRLPPRQRLRLFTQVCQAIQHAHQKGIIHRDIKPSNVLVTVIDGEPCPKVIDFGIAKATGQKLTEKTVVTQIAAFVGTPAYMSPEQAALTSQDVDTRSDIYSLGVLLYELLTGVTPFDQAQLLAAGLDEMRRLISEVDPMRPSARLSASLRSAGLLNQEGLMTAARSPSGQSPSVPPSHACLPRSAACPPSPEIDKDLDWIVMKCLEKDRTRRYETASGLAADIERHLNHEPVNARPPGNWYRFRKWVRRNRLAFAGFSLLLLSLTVVAVGASIAAWQVAGARRAEHDERQRTEVANRQLRGTVRLLELDRAEDFFRDDDAPQGMAHLAVMLRHDPSNHIAASRLVSALVHRDWSLPVGPPLLHSGPVHTVQFSPNGRRILSASRDGTARVWDAETRQILVTVRAGGRVLQARYSPGGDSFVTAAADGTARVWSAKDGTPITPLLTHADRVNWAEFSADGRWVVTASADRTARIWNAVTGVPKQTLVGHSKEVVVARFSPNGEVVATGNLTGGLRTWSVESGQTLVQMNVQSRIHALAFSPDGKRLVAAYDDGKARLWNSRDGPEVGESLVHSVERFPVWCAEFSPDGRFVLTTGEDGTAQLWDVEKGTPFGPRLQHAAGVVFGAFSPDGKRVVTTSSDNSARLWDRRSGRPLGQPLRGLERVVHAAFSGDSTRLVTASYAWSAQLWDIRPHRHVGRELLADDDVRSVAFNPDGRTLLGGTAIGTARIWNLEDGQPLSERSESSGPADWVEFSRDGKRFVLASGSRRTFTRDSATGVETAGPFEHAGGINAASFSPNGRRLVTASTDGTARVWDALTAEPITPPLVHRGPVLVARFSSNGRYVATASEDWTARVWDSQTGRPVTEPLAHLDHVRWVEFSPDGARVVTASVDNTACVWEVGTGRRVGLPLRHARIVGQAAFSPDGLHLATVSLDRTVRIWDAASGQPATPPLKHNHPATQVRFSPDGQRVLTSCRDALRLWDVETGRPLTEWLPVDGNVWSVCFDSTGRRVAAGAKRAWVWATPPVPVPVPGWFVDLAENAAGLRLDPRGSAELIPSLTFDPPTSGSIRTGADGFYERLAAWFLAAPQARPASPFD